jgi:hypothetical protein
LNILSILRLLIFQPSTCLVVQLLQGSQDLLRKNVALLVEEDEQALLSLHQLGQEEVVDLLDLVRNKELRVGVIKLFFVVADASDDAATLSISTLRIIILSISTLSITAHGTMTALTIIILSKRTVQITTHSGMTLGTATFNINRNNDTYKNPIKA